MIEFPIKGFYNPTDLSAKELGLIAMQEGSFKIGTHTHKIYAVEHDKLHFMIELGEGEWEDREFDSLAALAFDVETFFMVLAYE